MFKRFVEMRNNILLLIFRYANVRSLDNEHDGDEHATAATITAVAYQE